jgi:hypothetical protein
LGFKAAPQSSHLLKSVYQFSIAAVYQFTTAADNIEGNYEHMIVISLEYQALKTLLGQPKANDVMVYWSEDHYKWLYKKALVDQSLLGALVVKHGLMP